MVIVHHVCSEQDTSSVLPLPLKVQVQQQSQEVPVGIDGSFLDDAPYGRVQRHVVIQHQIRQHQRRGAAHSHDAVHQNFSVRSAESFVNEICCRFEVNVQIEVCGVVSGDPTVHKTSAVVVLVRDASSLGVSGVQNVSDAQILQRASVLCYSSDGKNNIQ